MNYYYECIRMLRKDLDCASKVGRDAENRGTVVLMNACIIFLTERVSTNCEAEDRNTCAYLTC